MVRYRLSRQNERRVEIVKTAKLPGLTGQVSSSLSRYGFDDTQRRSCEYDSGKGESRFIE